MCLMSCEPVKGLGRRWAYKVVANKDGELLSSYQYEKLEIGKWLRARGVVDDGWYPAGFHVFQKKADAETEAAQEPNEVVLRVKVRGIHTQGDFCGPCWAASQMFIPLQKKRIVKPKSKSTTRRTR